MNVFFALSYCPPAARSMRTVEPFRSALRAVAKPAKLLKLSVRKRPACPIANRPFVVVLSGADRRRRRQRGDVQLRSDLNETLDARGWIGVVERNADLHRPRQHTFTGFSATPLPVPSSALMVALV